MINRRSLITGLISLVAAPAIVRAGSLMPVKNIMFIGHEPYIDFERVDTIGQIKMTFSEYSPQNLAMAFMETSWER